VITPHPKEAARLLGIATAEVEADRLAAARALAARFGGVVVLKGARTLVCEGRLAWLSSAGAEALGTAGSGDVLAGAIAGLCAQGLSSSNAAVLGVWLHGRAGSVLGERLGRRGVLSSELPAQIGLELAGLSQPLR
jgi:NAD(P)H-hydrate epimerase